MVNRWRAVRRQRNLVLAVGLDDRLVLAAKHANMSVNGFIVGLIEEACDAGDHRGSADRDRVAPSVDRVGSSRGGVGDGDAVGVPGTGRPVDAFMALARQPRLARQVECVEPDPLDVIA